MAVAKTNVTTATSTNVTTAVYLFQLAATLKAVKAIVMYRGKVPEGTDCGFPVYTWDDFMEVRSYFLRSTCYYFEVCIWMWFVHGARYCGCGVVDGIHSGGRGSGACGGGVGCGCGCGCGGVVDGIHIGGGDDGHGSGGVGIVRCWC